MRFRAVNALCLALLLSGVEAAARVIPSAPVTQRRVIPAVQKRAARHVVVLELVSYGASCGYCVPTSVRAVVHDSLGVEPPRDVTPGGTPGSFSSAAAWEGDDGTLRLLLSGSPTFGILYSANGGATWAAVAVPAGAYLSGRLYKWDDFGGPVSHGVGSPIRLGTAAVPFVLSLAGAGAAGIWGVRADGSAYLLTPPTLGGLLVGSDPGGTRFLAFLYPAPPANSSQSPWTLSVLDLSGNLSKIFDTSHFAWNPWMEGWITPDGSAYINVDWTCGGNFGPPEKPSILPSTRSVALWKDGSIKEVIGSEDWRLLGAPTQDYAGAWIVRRDAGPTSLAFHTDSGGLVEVWRDESQPRISGVYAAESGERLLFLQTDPAGSVRGSFALAVWDIGQPAPAAWHRVFLNSEYTATLVHLDIDAAVTAGASIFVDPGAPQNRAMPSGGEPPPPTSPMSLVTAPLSRFSLRQQLVIPASARAPGLFGASWRTDLILRNPGASSLAVTVRLLPNPETSISAPDAILTVGPRSIAVVPDVLGSLFHLDRGSAALLLLPASGGPLDATSRTYTLSSKGTYGMAVDAEDVIAAARPGYSAAFAAGLLGSGFRTNLISSDLSGEGSRATLLVSAGDAEPVNSLAIEAPSAGQTQLDDVARRTGMPDSRTGSFRVGTNSGAAMTGTTVVDNSTNDPTWCGPDVLPGPITIPAVVHSDGANGARYRTDLFLLNPDAETRTLILSAASWNEPSRSHGRMVTLAPGESRRIPDVLFTLFGLGGVARLSVQSGFPSGGVSITSRTYTLLPDGSTYGMLVPPLVPWQIAWPGDSLEILGPTGGESFRTNLALVNVGSRTGTVHVEILDETGTLVDAFDLVVPSEGNVQEDDLFHKRGLGDGPKAALLRLTPSPDIKYFGLAAYATTIDNGTNDPVYFAGRVAAEE